jgi:hypothetical protein
MQFGNGLWMKKGKKEEEEKKKRRKREKEKGEGKRGNWRSSLDLADDDAEAAPPAPITTLALLLRSSIAFSLLLCRYWTVNFWYQGHTKCSDHIERKLKANSWNETWRRQKIAQDWREPTRCTGPQKK